jgi:O-antigen/teichoic acid export membrane protein
MAFASLLQSAENIGTVNFRKELNFRLEFKYQISKKLLGFFAVVPLAFALRSYWALVIGTLMARLGGLLLSFWMSSYRPRLSLKAGRELFAFSRWLLVGGAVVFARQRSSDFIIGRLAGPQTLGLFSIANELGMMPATEIVMPVSRASFPVYSTIADDLRALADAYLRVLGLVALIAAPAGVGLAATADLLVPIMFGPKWTDAIPVTALLGIYGVTLAIQGNIFPVFLARGRPQFSVWVVAFQLVCLLPLLVTLTRLWGSTGAGTAYLISGFLSMPLALYFASRELKMPAVRTIAVLWRPAVASGVMYLTLDLVPSVAAGDAVLAAMALRLAEKVLLGVAVFVAASTLLWLAAGRPAAAETTAFQYIARHCVRRFSRNVS